MKTTMSYFSGSIWFTIGSVLFSGVLGFFVSPHLTFAYMVSALTLGVLETSVSLDNAVVNAKYLAHMNERSKHWFLTWGMVIAVFGMRLILPIVIVSLAAWVNPWSATKMALFEPELYQKTMESVHTEIMGFGAGFLLMVTLEFFFDNEKDNHWIPGFEHLAALIGRFEGVQLLIAIPAVFALAHFAPHNGSALLYSSVSGILCFLFIGGVKHILEELEAEKEASMVASGTRLMVGALIFLEVLDASFSFDGVIAAFAITNQFLVIAAGLGIGAMFVRSLTIFLVDKDTMSELKYLENGAFWGIAYLVVTMFMSAYGIELGEAVVAGGAASIIILAAIHSWLVKEKPEAT